MSRFKVATAWFDGNRQVSRLVGNAKSAQVDIVIRVETPERERFLDFTRVLSELTEKEVNIPGIDQFSSKSASFIRETSFKSSCRRITQKYRSSCKPFARFPSCCTEYMRRARREA